MRKEVKLGMAFGVGLIALLVVYLLVSPPSNNRKGAQLVNGQGNEAVQPGDLGTVEERNERPVVRSDNPASTTSQNIVPQTPASPVTGQQPAVSPKAGEVAVKDTPRTGDSWTMLSSGKGGAPGTGDSTLANKVENKAIAQVDHPTPIRTAESPAAPAGKMYFDPHGAWGGGVSSDAVMGSPRTGGKATIITPGQGAPEAATPGKTHVVRQGETFSSIALTAYGSASLYSVIIKANPNLNPNNLKPGTTINLPSLDEVKAARPGGAVLPATPVSVKIDSSHQYQVKSGDSLYKIAIQLYGKSSYVEKIYEKNKAGIGPNPTRLKLGMILELPEKPTQLVEADPARANSTGGVSASPANNTTATLQETPASELR